MSLLNKMEIKLIILLHSGRGHAIDDWILVFHSGDWQGDGQQGENQDDAEPKDDVEHDWIVGIVNWCQIVVDFLMEIIK